MKYRLLDDESANAPAIVPEQESEGWGDYLKRNVAKIPALAFETARSGLGVGNILEEVGREAEAIHDRSQENMPPGLRAPIPRPLGRKITQTLLPSREQAHEEAKKIFPKYYVEKKEGDAPFEFLLTELPFLATTGAFKSLPSLGRGIAASAGIFGGSELGSRVGSYIGEKLGGETGKAKGQFAGSLLGGIGGSAAAHTLTNRPSKFFEKKYLQNASLDTIDKEFRSASENILKEREQAFENVKKSATEREKRIKDLETSRHPEYAQAERAAVNIKDQAPEIKSAIKKIEKSLELGVEKADRNRISEVGRQVENLLRKKDLSLEELKTFKKNLNASRYDKNLSPVVKNAFSELVNATNEAITRLGKEHPEHGKPFSSAEQKTVELKKLKNEQSQFDADQRQQLRDITKRYNEDIRDLKSELQRNKVTLKNQDAFVQGIKDVKGLFNKSALGALGYYVSSFLGFGPAGKKIGAFLGGIAHKGAQEAKVYSTMFREHPDLIQDYNKLIADGVKGNKVQIVRQIKIINDKTAQYADDEPEEVKYRLLD